MSENTANVEKKALRKEKKTLDYRIALVLMIVMIIIALFNGASKAWKKNRGSVDAAYAQWQENVQQRIETSYNILTVSGRYLADSDAKVVSLKNDMNAMNASSTDSSSFNAQVLACDSFIQDSKALLNALSANEQVQQDARDAMYVNLMLPQAVEQCSNSAALSEYNAAAQAYNEGLHSFSGFLARIIGIDYAPTVDTALLEKVAAEETV